MSKIFLLYKVMKKFGYKILCIYQNITQQADITYRHFDVKKFWRQNDDK